MAKRVAVIDIGSNSVRMVVFEKTSRFAFHLLHEAKSKVRISENAYENNGNLQEKAMQRTYNALAEFLQIAASFKANKVLCVATSALRDAPNKQDFLQRVRHSLSLNIKIIDGEKESYYGAIACANLLPQQENSLTIDIGGGSTEFSLLKGKEVTNTLSLELGTVRLKELFFDKQKIDEAIAYIDTKLEALSITSADAIIGIGGTFRAISSALLTNTKHPLNKIHGFETSYAVFNQFLEDILNANESKLKKLGIKSDRFDVIKPGALILHRVLKRVTTQKLISSGVGVREGVYLADLLRNSKHKLPQNYNTSVRYLLDNYISEKEYANQLNSLSKKLFDLLAPSLGIDQKYRYELSIAAKLYPIGNNIHFYSKNKHSYYLIQSALEYGFTHAQITLIATLTRFAKSKSPSAVHLNKYKTLLPHKKELTALSYILSLSISLLTHRPRSIDFSLELSEKTLKIISPNELYLTKDAVNKLEGLKDLKVSFHS